MKFSKLFSKNDLLCHFPKLTHPHWIFFIFYHRHNRHATHPEHTFDTTPEIGPFWFRTKSGSVGFLGENQNRSSRDVYRVCIRLTENSIRCGFRKRSIPAPYGIVRARWKLLFFVIFRCLFFWILNCYFRSSARGTCRRCPLDGIRVHLHFVIGFTPIRIQTK